MIITGDSYLRRTGPDPTPIGAGRHDQMLRDTQARRGHQRAEQLNEGSGIEALFDVGIEQVRARPIANNLVYRHVLSGKTTGGADAAAPRSSGDRPSL